MAVAKKENNVHVGGQAVIEGVMMRSPDAVSVAVRKADGSIVYRTRPFVSLTKRSKFWALPILRGALVLFESLVLGIQALSFSSEVAIQEVEKEKNKETKESAKRQFWSKVIMALTLIVALGIGLGLFFYLPLVATQFVGVESGIIFNLIDGGFRLLVFLAYLGTIALWKEIRRVFEYHGAEHKSIKAFENKEDLSTESASKYSTFHPRCGTSFLLVVVMVSILVFAFLGKPHGLVDPIVLARLALVPVIAGISYEFIRLGGRHTRNSLVRVLVAPGLWLQRITTREPDDKQLEVAFVALRSALGEDVSAVATPYVKTY